MHEIRLVYNIISINIYRNLMLSKPAQMRKFTCILYTQKVSIVKWHAFYDIPGPKKCVWQTTSTYNISDALGKLTLHIWMQ